MRLQGKVAVITGGIGHGLGYAPCLQTRVPKLSLAIGMRNGWTRLSQPFRQVAVQLSAHRAISPIKLLPNIWCLASAHTAGLIYFVTMRV